MYGKTYFKKFNEVTLKECLQRLKLYLIQGGHFSFNQYYNNHDRFNDTVQILSRHSHTDTSTEANK